jgi:vacuolar-type H+-ATPase subunit H
MEPPERSPLVVIKEKELELADRRAAAKESAARAILDAQKWAANLREQAEREGQVDAAAFYRSELEAAEREAASIISEGELVAAQIAKQGQATMSQAVTRILEIVLPGTEDT